MNELRPIPNYEGLYSINRKGQVFSHTYNRFVRTSSPHTTYGYSMVHLINKNGHGSTYAVKRLVEWAFSDTQNALE